MPPNVLLGSSYAFPSFLTFPGNNLSLRRSPEGPSFAKPGLAAALCLSEGQSFAPILLLPQTRNEVSFLLS